MLRARIPQKLHVVAFWSWNFDVMVFQSWNPDVVVFRPLKKWLGLIVSVSRCRGVSVPESRCRGFLVLESQCRGFLVLESWCRGICVSTVSFSFSLNLLWYIIKDTIKAYKCLMSYVALDYDFEQVIFSTLNLYVCSFIWYF